MLAVAVAPTLVGSRLIFPSEIIPGRTELRALALAHWLSPLPTARVT